MSDYDVERVAEAAILQHTQGVPNVQQVLPVFVLPVACIAFLRLAFVGDARPGYRLPHCSTLHTRRWRDSLAASP